MRLAGGALTEIARDRTLNPWFVAVDELRQTLEGRNTPFVSFANYDYLGPLRASTSRMSLLRCKATSVGISSRNEHAGRGTG